MTDGDPKVYFLLQRAAHRLKRAADRTSAAAAGVTTAQLAVLMVIDQEPGCTQRRVASVLAQTESATMTMLARLQSAGLVTRTPNPSEHRAMSLALTPAGSSALSSGGEEMKRFNERIRDVLGDDLAPIADGLDRLLAADFGPDT
ncbi:putative MarR family transcriptional regulator [Gordonia araii NBRC 100433]|uniref:Putative MarR family transcriptional regulator n=1 Tax=Gordonia araii NBRC 100433 TaxID=1073574 RepID=G7H644_9ACTN|nr:MarR family winged helix-turn-helix transcriptional regulator [Gordonia araii]NNG98719.1 winged helix-turn-helix transcriptional regulator [Gordonia araii NBRC 100433]GAB11283.1 putative MarR family transcriptional regulator [Gordonia araii NBRC 100433]